MTFREQIRDDLESVFLNLSGFGETGEIAGHENVPMVVESLELEMPQASDDRPGVSYEGVTVYVNGLDVPEKLLPNRQVTFRHENWFVLSCATDESLKTLRLYREVS